MNRRKFLREFSFAVAGFQILPSAGRIWKAQRKYSDISDAAIDNYLKSLVAAGIIHPPYFYWASEEARDRGIRVLIESRCPGSVAFQSRCSIPPQFFDQTENLLA
jgi:hypothetical protein